MSLIQEEGINAAPYPDCKDINIENKVTQISALLKVLEPMLGPGNSSSFCTGTMGSDWSYGPRQVMFMLAATDPYPDIDDTDDPDSYFWGEDKERTLKLLHYIPDIKHWSQQGNWEKKQYALLQKITPEVQNQLQAYYIRTFHVSEEQAKVAAEYYTGKIILSYVGRSGGASTLDYPSLCLTATDLDAYLKTNQLPTKECPYAEFVNTSKAATLRRLLGIAIINNYSTHDIQKLIAEGADLNLKLRTEEEIERTHIDTPLMMAAPRTDIMEVLIKAGADTNIQNWFGKTALMYAIQEQNLEGVKMLLKAGANINQSTLPISYSGEDQFAHSDVVCSSLKAGNRTALMYAAWQSTPEIIKLIIAANADVNAKDSNGDTAANYLAKNTTLKLSERQDIEMLLRSPSQETPHS